MEKDSIIVWGYKYLRESVRGNILEDSYKNYCKFNVSLKIIFYLTEKNVF